ncbi:2',3'-cyclic-nucleotide 3'-phosphodiesterase [Entelurus aequoreus]|uniref:2',3'-cyclic-nucleotide 3'-phosphodiesterase n=1 Tax=Entelurus aequoreus TaxID=161455 RepID=UPI002B1D2D71|nr:2',3'-cyclic-nucleotide 3'-phosphodiesterase [Entelurus aequoreus]
MDPENNCEVSPVVESPQQQEEETTVAATLVMEEVVTQLEHFTEPEEPAADEEHVVNGTFTYGDAGTDMSEKKEETEAEAVVVPQEMAALPESSSELDPDSDDLPELIPETEPTTQEVITRELQAEPRLPSPEEKTLEQVEAVMDAVAEDVIKEAPQEDNGAHAKGDAKLEVSAEKAVEVVVPDKEATSSEAVPPAEPQKDVEPEKSAESVVSTGAAPEKESPAPAAGSLAFALLDQEKTKDALRGSRTLVVLRGLPGSGKSFLARVLADAYKDRCSIFCADDYGVKPENQDTSAEGHKALDAALAACCANPSALVVVVDDTNHTQDRLARLGELAREHRLVAVFLEPRTEWSRDAARLAKTTARKLKPAQITSMKRQLEEMSLPLFFAWFLLTPVQDQLRSTNTDFLKALSTLDAFKKHTIDFTGNEEELDLTQYFKAKGSLHCTTKFCNYGKEAGAKEYAENPVVADSYGSVFELSLGALFVTPRTAGARVRLTEEQLQLWPSDSEKGGQSTIPAADSLPVGSRAHVTLGCAQGVEAVQTGLDLLEILVLQKEGQQGELVADMDLGPLRYYGKGRWMLELKEPICVPVCFSSFYKREGPDGVQGKKDPKKKCTIL